MTLNPDASEYIPISQSTLGLLYPYATHVTAGFHVSPPSVVILPYSFPCVRLPTQGLIQSPPPCRTYFLSPSPLPPPPPPQPTDVEPTSDQPESFATKEKAELLFPRIISGKKFVPSYNTFPRSCRSTFSTSSRGGFWSSGGKRCGRRRLMSVDSRGMKPKDNERCDLKKHGVLPLCHDEEITTVMIKNIPYEFT